jgi:hypothetical protein
VRGAALVIAVASRDHTVSIHVPIGDQVAMPRDPSTGEEVKFRLCMLEVAPKSSRLRLVSEKLRESREGNTGPKLALG